MDATKVPISIASSGTTGTLNPLPGYRLTGILLPALDNTTVVPAVSFDNGSSYQNCYDSAGNQITLGGAANTGDRLVQVPESLAMMLNAGDKLRLTLASQTGGARTLYGIFVRGGF